MTVFARGMLVHAFTRMYFAGDPLETDPTLALVGGSRRETLVGELDTKLKEQGARVLGDGEPKIGAHGKRVLFLHPKDFLGTLVELEEA